MSQDSKRYVSAVLTLIGAVIGVGIFGVPYALSRAGVVVGLGYFAVLGGIQLLQHLFYAEAAIAAEQPLRLVGLVDRYLGRTARHIAAVALVLGFWAAMLAYLLVGGTFLHALLAPYLGGSEFMYQLAWTAFATLALFFGLDAVTKIDAAATVGLVVALLAIFVFGMPHVNAAYFSLGLGSDLFLPYGVILFSLSGLPAILEMEDILKGKRAHYRSAVIVGTLASLALTAAFGFMVWGITGAATTQDAAGGLAAALGPGASVLVAAFGFLAIATSFFATGINLQDTFEDDYRLPRGMAWLCTIGAPVVAFLAGAKDFVGVVGFSGAVFGGITAVLVSLLYIAVVKGGFVKEKKLGVPVWTAYACIAVLAVGAAYETFAAASKIW